MKSVAEQKKCNHSLVKTDRELSGLHATVYVCSKCGYACEPRLAREKWGVVDEG